MSEQEALDPDAIMAEYIRNRGDIFDEWHFMVRYVPLTVVKLHDTAGYILKNDNKTTPDQQLSLQFRELIALCHLSAKGNARFAANHVRRLYRSGVTNAVMFEAIEALSTVIGHSTIAHVAEAIMLANDPNYPFGRMPEGGEPKSLTPFPELDMGWESSEQPITDRATLPQWQYCADIDPELAKRSAAFVNHCLTDRQPGRVLSPGTRELIAVTGLCTRGLCDTAAKRIRRVYAYGFTKRQVLEAISVTHNMTGSISVEIGLEAMMKADGFGARENMQGE
jgi:alkylhydroperoxidase/carboxymuconolactone decarboxylase family protein YurZ